jgi:hypothetical protein
MILKKDAVHAIVNIGGLPERCAVRIVHFEECMDKRTWRKIWRYMSDRPCFVHKDVPTVRTRGGRVVVAGVHGVTKLYDGTYDFHSNAETGTAYDVTFTVPAGHTFSMADLPHIEPWVREIVGNRVCNIREDYEGSDASVVGRKLAWALIKYVRQEYGGLPKRLADGRWEMDYHNRWHAPTTETWAYEEALPKLADDMQWCHDNDTAPFAEITGNTDYKKLRVALFMSAFMPHIREILPQPATIPAPTVVATVVALGTDERFAIAA